MSIKCFANFAATTITGREGTRLVFFLPSTDQRMNIAMEQVSISEVQTNEIAELQELSKQIFIDTFAIYNTQADMDHYLNESFSHDRLMSELCDPNSTFYFARIDDRLVGYLKINIAGAQTEMKNDHSLEIERLYVLHEFHGKKVGQILFDMAIQLAVDKGMDYIWLGVWEKNARALRFYEKNGFMPFGQHIFKLGNDEQLDIMMKKSLK